LAVFYLGNLPAVIWLAQRNSRQLYKLKLDGDGVQENINVQSASNQQERANTQFLQRRIERYENLKRIIELLNQELSLDAVAEQLCAISFFLLADNQGECLLYLLDGSTQKLVLFKTLKDERAIVIKAKEGDSFDHWVLRHASPLLVEDISKDFRFDADKVRRADPRPIASLIEVPLISGGKVIGLIRLEHQHKRFFAQDDLRFFMTIAELGAVSLENAQLYKDARTMAIHDGLTGLFNKGYFLEMLKTECRRTYRHPRSLCLLMLDIDNFKKLNDTFGHAAGDIVLVTISKAVSEALAQIPAVVCRFGGEEFCVLLPDTDKNTGLKIAENLRKAVAARELLLRRQRNQCTISVGVAEFPHDAQEEIELLMKADRALYEAKSKGRNLVIGA